jgi:hypothetical protein
MRLMLGRYLRLLEAAARQPELLLRKLLLIAGPRPLRWLCANYAAPFLRLRYSLLFLIAAIKDVLETYQEVDLIRRLTAIEQQ